MTTTASVMALRVGDAIRDAVSTFTIPGIQVAWSCDGVADEVMSGDATPDTRFPLGSATKVFTASLALQLVSDGALALDEAIADALPAGACGEVTLRQLLTHTSGLEDDPVGAEGPCGSPSEYVRACTRELLFPAGQHFSYANAGYVVVGHLVERAMEQPWAEGVRSFLLDPLDAGGTFFLSERAAPGVVADGHVRRADGAPWSGLGVTGRVSAPDGAERAITLPETVPGRYEGAWPAAAAGADAVAAAARKTTRAASAGKGRSPSPRRCAGSSGSSPRTG